MGGAASIEVRHTHSSFAHVTDAHFQELLSSKHTREQLFDDIVKYPVDGKLEKSQLVSLVKLAAYFTDNANTLYPGFHVNVDTLNAAFKYTVRKHREKQSQRKKKKLSKSAKARLQAEPKLSKAMVHSFLPTLLLFIRVWDVFDAADKLVVEDQRVFKGEFMRIKQKLNNLHGIVILGDTADDSWEKEFEILDKNNDRFITFEEMCNYALDHIKRPFDYKPEEEDVILEEDDEDESEGEDDAADDLMPSFVAVVAHNLTKPLVEPVSVSTSAAVLPPASSTSEKVDASPRGEPQDQAASEESAVGLPTGSADSAEDAVLPSSQLLFV